MGKLRVGDKTPSKIFYGRTPVKQAYYGATKIWPEIPAWESGTYYNPGDVVEYEGSTYQCSRTHKSNAEYTPTSYRGSDFWWHLRHGGADSSNTPGFSAVRYQN